MTFPETELRAYEGAYLDYDAMPPAKYKYFARIANLGRDVRAGRKTPAEAATARNEYLAEYNRTMEKNVLDRHHQAHGILPCLCERFE